MAVLVIHSNLREFTEQYGWFILTNVCVADIVDLGNALMPCYWLNKTMAEIKCETVCGSYNLRGIEQYLTRSPGAKRSLTDLFCGHLVSEFAIVTLYKKC